MGVYTQLTLEEANKLWKETSAYIEAAEKKDFTAIRGIKAGTNSTIFFCYDNISQEDLGKILS